MSDNIRDPNSVGPHTQVATTVPDGSDNNSVVSWAAIFAGAAGAMALSLLLLVLGSGLGLSVLSPWSLEGSAATLGFAAIAWLTFTQLAASGMGGYLAGRLRTRWPGVHYEEVYFRDTAHGFLTWAISTLLMVLLTALVTGSIVSGGLRAGAEMSQGDGDTVAMVARATTESEMSGELETLDAGETMAYYVDSLFRGASYDEGAENREIPSEEVSRVFVRALSVGELTSEDQRHLGQLITDRTDLSQTEAEQRVANIFEDVESTLEDMKEVAQEAAEEAGKASAFAALWITISLLIGAFFASLMAVFGGRQRDT